MTEADVSPDSGASMHDHERFMRLAIEQAHRALASGEVPVGAVVVIEGRLVSAAFNHAVGAVDPTAHAEVVAVREAARAVGNYRLTDATLYVTVEPCLMCVGALVHVAELPGLNHRFIVTGGVLEAECRELMQQFFQARRRAAKGGVLAGGESDAV
jgi:tRNA(adenine34) deaminase